MPMLSTRLLLPLTDFKGARSSGTIKTIQAGTFEDVDDNFPNAVTEMLVSIDNELLCVDDDLVTV